ncbi:ATP-binding protein [Lactiplantibacillus plantarum]|uniref:ATP-binding protein n=2 Tax=Lactiplantibacillus plantarum TaxID=1590 RepID=UPI001599E7D7|nr:ATP-binding protein [Lactiplantibacillus plantarum]QKX11513.1 hypothetical protein Heal19_502907 [Lactiplantibacillus plantarum]WIR72305.1 ATP-binding protein [Lactiplantibacillus plantarum]
MVAQGTVATAMLATMAKHLETFNAECPICGKELLRPIVLNKTTGEKMSGACPNCGYMQPLGTRNTPNDVQLTTVAKKNDALGYLNTYSLFSNFNIFNHRFSNFETKTAAEQRAFKFAQQLADRIINGHTVHGLLIGKPGLGKTHLAISVVYKILENSNYQRPGPDHAPWKIIFIDWRDLIVEKKQSFNDDNLAKQINRIMSAIKLADVVILDDFGSERQTDYALDLADEFWRQREDKTVITTSNLTGTGLPSLYGDRLISRMKKHGTNNSIEFKGDDYRGKM